VLGVTLTAVEPERVDAAMGGGGIGEGEVEGVANPIDKLRASGAICQPARQKEESQALGINQAGRTRITPIGSNWGIWRTGISV